jgi:hypothetical protein
MPNGRSPADHVILVSVDALRPEFYLDERWPAPVLQQLAAAGARARAVRSVFPALTYPSHTSMVTGALPARHGIYFNHAFCAEGATDRWQWEAERIRVPTLWDAVRAAGGTTAAVGWPATVGAAIDWNVPDVWPLDPAASIVDAVRPASTPGLWEELEREATGRLLPVNFGLDRLAREARVAGMAAYLFERHRPTLLLVHLIAADHVQHQWGRDHAMTRRAVGVVDAALGEIVERVEALGTGGRVAFVVVGDHGAVDRHTVLRPNVWLVDAGLMGDGPDRGGWRATFHADGGSAFLRLRSADDADAVDRVRAVLHALPPAERALFRIVERAELGALGADPEAPFALAAVPGVELSSLPAPPLLAPTQGGTHGYHPDEPQMHTGFVAYGAGVRPGARVPLLAVQAVAPLVAALLGIPFDAPDAVLFPGLLA